MSIPSCRSALLAEVGLAALVLGALAAGCLPARDAPPAPTVDAPHAVHADTALVDSLARAFFEAHTLPSLVVGLVDSTGRRVWVYGDADSLGPPDIHTRYEIASITKVFTALALADLAARGTVALDDPVSAYLPDSLAVPEHVTLERLASHTAGLPFLPPGIPLTLDPYATYTVRDLFSALGGIHIGAPGDYLYSNLGVGLLGHALARAEGVTYADLIQTHVLRPLGLEETSVFVPDTARLAQPHAQPGQTTPPWTFTDAFAGAGALRASTADMLALLAVHLDPPADLPPSLAEAIAMVKRPRVSIPAHSFSVALGWHRSPIGTDGASLALWHNGSTGGTRSFAGYVSGNTGGGVGVVVFTNIQQDVTDFGLELLGHVATASPGRDPH